MFSFPLPSYLHRPTPRLGQRARCSDCFDGLTILVALLAAFFAGSARAQLVPHELVHSAMPPISNPLKGFLNFSSGEDPGSTDFPYSLEFFYIGMEEFYGAPAVSGEFNFSALEIELESIKNRGRQAVFRIFIDFPEPLEGMSCPNTGGIPEAQVSMNFALPEFLFVPDGGMPLVAITPYCDAGTDGFGWSPDYTDVDLLSEIVGLTAALRANYDNDARIGYIEVGFLGHWGEWHTFLMGPLDPLACDDGLDSDHVLVHGAMNQVLDEFNDFMSTRTVVSADILQCAFDFSGSDPGVDLAFFSVGIHDDDFANATACEPFGYASRSELLGFDQDWKSLAIGGEVQPDLQESIHADDDGSPTTPCEMPATARDSGELNEATNRVHASWLLDYNLFNDESPSTPAMQFSNAEDSNRSMGYQLYVSRVELPGSLATFQLLDLGVRIENLGVAPLAYDLLVELVVLDGATEAAVLPLDDVHLIDVLDDTAVDFSILGLSHGLAAGVYDLALRVPNPMTGGMALRFANESQVGDLLMLPPLTVVESLIFADGFESGNTTAWN